MRKKGLVTSLYLLAIGVALVGFYIFSPKQNFRIKVAETGISKTSQTAQTTASSSKAASDLPDVSPDDWELILVNREHPTEELNPTVSYVEGIPVDSRIAEATTQFMAVVRSIDSDPLQGLYSGYRSVAEQELLFQTRVAEAMSAGATEEEATATVSQTVMPAGSSEHHTGLAIDLMKMSDFAKEIAAVAPEYGFVLRYDEGDEHITGISHEDWHFRYVGVASAKYMTEHDLTLEEYLDLLRGNQS